MSISNNTIEVYITEYAAVLRLPMIVYTCCQLTRSITYAEHVHVVNLLLVHAKNKNKYLLLDQMYKTHLLKV